MFEKNREASALAAISRAIAEQKNDAKVRACELKNNDIKANLYSKTDPKYFIRYRMCPERLRRQ